VGSEYAQKARGLEFSYGGVVSKYILDRQVLDMPYLIYLADSKSPDDLNSALARGELPSDLGIFMPVIDRCDPGLVPAGKQLLIAGTFAPSSPGSELIERLRELMEQRIFQIFPEVEKHVVERLAVGPEDISRASGRSGIGDVIGLAQVPGQVGRDKPSPVTPVEGLYLVGCDAGARGIGTEQAAGSAEKVAGIVRERHPLA
jgi:prolycopene isomerase